jgi:alpha-beta hydrolase superfamily lysophospholipase
MQHREFGWVSRDGLQLYAQAWAPDGEPQAVVCLVHGIGEHSGRYAYVAGRLTAAGYAVLAYDQRGHGRSPGPRGHTPSFDHLLDDIGLLLDQAERLYPDLPCFLYGHSLGGGLVLNFAIRRQPQIAGVISTSPSLRQTKPSPALQLALGRILYRLAPSFTMASGLELAAISRDPEVVRVYQADPLVHNRVSAQLGIDLIDTGQWALDHAAEFPVSLLLIHGAADRITSPEASREFAARAPGDVSLHILEGAYHETHNEPEKDHMTQIVIDWLAERSAGLPVKNRSAAGQA